MPASRYIPVETSASRETSWKQRRLTTQCALRRPRATPFIKNARRWVLQQRHPVLSFLYYNKTHAGSNSHGDAPSAPGIWQCSRLQFGSGVVRCVCVGVISAGLCNFKRHKKYSSSSPLRIHTYQHYPYSHQQSPLHHTCLTSVRAEHGSHNPDKPNQTEFAP